MDIAQATNFLSSLSSTGLMALMVVILAMVVKKFYEKGEAERKVLFDKIFNSIKNIDSKLEEANNIHKTASLISESQRDLLEKNYQLQNTSVKQNYEAMNSKLNNVTQNVEKTTDAVNDVKKDTELLKKAAGENLNRTGTLITLYKKDSGK